MVGRGGGGGGGGGGAGVTLNESASQQVGLDPMVSGLGEEGLDGGWGGKGGGG